jgi:hypothetical protein
MNWLVGFKMFVKFIPCVVGVFRDMKAAKKDDDTIDAEEWGEIVGKGIECVVSKIKDD